MADETTPSPGPPPTAFEVLAARVTDLEAAVASLGSPSVTQSHDGLGKFREWLMAFVSRVT
jgi:hypothetical protein